MTVLLTGEVERKARLAIGGWDAQPQPAALTDSEAVRAGVLTDLDASGVDDVANPGAEPVVEEPRGIAVGDEADVMAVRLVRNGEAASCRLSPYLGLLPAAEREDRCSGLLKHAQDDWSFAASTERCSSTTPPGGHQPGVVPVQTASKPSAIASSTAENLIRSPACRFRVRPAAYSATKSSTTSAANRSDRSQM